MLLVSTGPPRAQAGEGDGGPEEEEEAGDEERHAVAGDEGVECRGERVGPDGGRDGGSLAAGDLLDERGGPGARGFREGAEARPPRARGGGDAERAEHGEAHRGADLARGIEDTGAGARVIRGRPNLGKPEGVDRLRRERDLALFVAAGMAANAEPRLTGAQTAMAVALALKTADGVTDGPMLRVCVDAIERAWKG